MTFNEPPISSNKLPSRRFEFSVCRLDPFRLSLQIALQFPDELLHDSVPVYKALRQILGPEINLYVLADTSYGRQVSGLQPFFSGALNSKRLFLDSCCVDEVAAEHVNSDLVIHYGHTCLSMCVHF